jgi:hypothetical protein
MCSYTTLAHSEHGYIIQCKACNSIQLAFGAIAIALHNKDFGVFTEQLKTLAITSTHVGTPTQKTIKIDVFSEHVLMIVSHIELMVLITMLEEAEAKLAVNTMLKECNLLVV